MGTALMALGVLVAVYAAYGAFVYAFQPRYVYLPTREWVTTPDLAGLPYEDVSLVTTDGVRLHAWWVPAKVGSAPAVLFCHGNGGNVSHRVGTLRALRELGMATLIFDYRGYGVSDGSPSERGTYLDAEAALRHLTDERGIAPGRIVVHGRSLGGAIAAWLAERTGLGAQILESTFTSVPGLAAMLFPLLPARRLARFSYDTESSVRRVRCPVLVIHSPDDELIPYEHGRALFAVANEPKSFLDLAGGHNDGFVVSEISYKAGLRAFFEATFET